jgi:hypothetical protein
VFANVTAAAETRTTSSPCRRAERRSNPRDLDHTRPIRPSSPAGFQVTVACYRLPQFVAGFPAPEDSARSVFLLRADLVVLSATAFDGRADR